MNVIYNNDVKTTQIPPKSVRGTDLTTLAAIKHMSQNRQNTMHNVVATNVYSRSLFMQIFIVGPTSASNMKHHHGNYDLQNGVEWWHRQVITANNRNMANFEVALRMHQMTTPAKSIWFISKSVKRVLLIHLDWAYINVLHSRRWGAGKGYGWQTDRWSISNDRHPEPRRSAWKICSKETTLLQCNQTRSTYVSKMSSPSLRKNHSYGNSIS